VRAPRLLGVLASTALLGLIGPQALVRHDPSRVRTAAIASLSPASLATVFGRSGSFGSYGSHPSLPTGEPTTTHVVPAWSSSPGQAMYSAAITEDGTVVLPSEPQTDDQLLPTATTMELSLFAPASDRLTHLAVPTSAGRTEATDPFSTPRDVVGGGDVSAVQVVANRVLFVSAAPYHGWRRSFGQYPSFGALTKTGAAWSLDGGSTRTADDLASAAAIPAPCRSLRNGYGERFADCGGLSSMGVLAGSTDVAVTQYFGATGGTSGGLMVLSDAGQVIATYRYPAIVSSLGAISVHPRDVTVDPSSSPGAERFAVVFDVFSPDGHQLPSTLQEFRFDAASRRIVPITVPFVSGDAGLRRSIGVEMARYDGLGNLWVAQSDSGTLAGADLVEYRAGAVLPEVRCAPGADWSRTQWAQSCAPDVRVPAAAGLGLVRSLTEDPRTHAMLAATLSGDLIVVSRGDPPALSVRVIDLGLGWLRDRATAWIGPRGGAVDIVGGVMWLPIQQLRNPSTCARYPCPPQVLDQWLDRIDLTQAEAPPPTS
jgi:hypothetical protein